MFLQTKLSDQVKKVESAIVGICILAPDKQRVKILGTGFSISNDGTILSAAHLLNDYNRDKSQGTLTAMIMDKSDGLISHYKWVPIISWEKIDNQNDLVIFKISDYENTLLSQLELGDSDRISVGNDAYFIGFPYAGELMNEGFGITLVVNKTIISNIKRYGDGPNKGQIHFIFVDAISNPGNSGSPLVDLAINKVIGVMAISFAKKSANEKVDIREPMHIAAARPINFAKKLL